VVTVTMLTLGRL